MIIITLIIGALVSLLLASAIVLLLRTFLKASSSNAELDDCIDVSWKDYRPIHRLLDPADFEYLRKRGVSEQNINKLRKERRKIYRMCLRSVAQDFNNVHRALRLVMAYSHEDRSDLAAVLTKERFSFYRGLLVVEVRLTLHAFGFEKMPEIDLLRSLETLQAQLRQLSPVTATAAV